MTSMRQTRGSWRAHLGTSLFLLLFVGGASRIAADCSDPPTVSMQDAAIVEEGNVGTKQVVFHAIIPGVACPGISATVSYTTADVSATAGEDYIATSGSVTVVQNMQGTGTPIYVTVLGDTVPESHEVFKVSISDPIGGFIGDPVGFATLLNDERRVTVADLFIDEGDSGTTNAVIDVTLDLPYELPVTVDYTTADNQANAPEDYLTTSGTLTFPAGETLQTITVPIVGDTVIESDENFRILLSNAPSLTISGGAGFVEIINDDFHQITIGDASVLEGDDGVVTLDFLVEVSPPKLFFIPWTTVDGTAVAGSDYTAASGTLTLSSTTPSDTISIEVQGDFDFESDETLQLVLTAPAGAELVDGGGIGTILNDDPQLGQIGVSDPSVVEGDEGTTSDLVFAVSLVSTVANPVQVDFSVIYDTATANEDFLPLSGTINIPAGEISQEVVVTILGDDRDECDETLNLVIFNPVNATLIDSSGVGTIITDDLLGCENLDGDCFHATECGGMDCADGDPSVYPGAPELNDSLDNQCPGDPGFGLVDEIENLRLSHDSVLGTALIWDDGNATLFEVLFSSDPTFATACFSWQTPDPFYLDTLGPVISEVRYYMVRAVSLWVGDWGVDSEGILLDPVCSP